MSELNNSNTKTETWYVYNANRTPRGRIHCNRCPVKYKLKHVHSHFHTCECEIQYIHGYITTNVCTINTGYVKTILTSITEM